MSEKICVFACATKATPRLEVLRKSMDLYEGWGLCVLGEGKEWKSFRTKMECYRDALRITKKDQVVVCLDAYDAICVRDSHQLKEDFLSFDTPILIGYENVSSFTIYNKYVKIGVSPSISKWKKYHNIDLSEKIFVNSGCIVGYAGEICKMFDWILNYRHFEIDDDQIGVGYYMNKFPHKVKLDVESKICLNDNYGNNYKVRVHDHRLHVMSRHVPYFIHFPGIRYVDPFKQTNYDLVAPFIVGKYEQSMNHDDRNRDRRRNRFLLLLFVMLVVLVFFMLFRKKKKNIFQKRKKNN